MLYEDPEEEDEGSEASMLHNNVNNNVKHTTVKAANQHLEKQTERRMLNSSCDDDFLTKRMETSKSTTVIAIFVPIKKKYIFLWK